MTKADAILEQAREDLRDHLRDFCKYAPAYLEGYVDALLRDATTTWKAREARAHLHPKLAEFLRELALDATVMDRLPSSRPVESTTRDNDRPLTESQVAV